jgi:RNA polymerase sigma factor (sigma-70 family)
LARHGWIVPINEAPDVVRSFVLDLTHGLLPRWQPERANFATYAYNQLKWSIRDRLQKDARFQQQSVDFHSIVDARRQSPSDAAEGAELGLMIRNALQRLPVETRTVLERYLDHPSERDVAKALGKSRHEVRNHLADGFGTLLIGFPRPAYVSEDDWRVLQCLYAAGLTMAETSRLLKRDVSELRELRGRLLSRLSQAARV